MTDKRALCCLVLALCGAAAQADTVALQASRDNTLFEDPAGQISNGAGPAFYAGLTLVDTLRRGLLRFDLSGIPAGSTVTSMSLTLHLSRSISSNTPVQLHRALRDWGEGTSNAGDPGGLGAPATANDATWLHTFFSTQLWSADGGLEGTDFATSPSASAIVNDIAGFCTWGSTVAMVADAQAWLDNPATNFGWFVIGDEANIGTAKRFDSREAPDPTFRPVLTVTFTPPCYANCDASSVAPILTANDFQCFLNEFAAQSPAANCDGSTAAPVLTANDFQCFLNTFAAGCS